MNPLTTRRRRTAVLVAALMALLVGLTACGAATGEPGGKEVSKIRFQSGAGNVDALMLADALGYLEGLELEKVGDVTGGPQSLQALSSRQIDISASAFYGAIAQLAATGAPIKTVVPTYGSTGGLNQKLSVLKESPIRSAKDLIGKKIAVNTLGANSEAVLDTWLEQEGLTQEEQDKVELVVLPPLNTPTALQEGQVDAAMLSFASYELAAKTLELRTLVTDVDVVGEYAGGGFSMNKDFIAKNPETTRTLVEGIARAVNYVETHEKQEIFDVYFPYLEKNGYGDYIEAIEANFPGTYGLPAEPVISDEDFTRWLDWLDSRGDVDADEVEVSEIYTNEFNPYAK